MVLWVFLIDKDAFQKIKLEHNAELKLEQLSIGTAAQTVANAAAGKAAASAVTSDRAAAEQTDAIDVGELAAAINDDAKIAATISNLHKEIQRLQAAADEATATINNLEAENKRIVLQLATAKAAATTKVRVPGYNVPMTHAEHAQALQRQIQYLLNTRAIPAADRAILAATADVAESATASSRTVPANANEPSWERHIRSQPGASIATSNSATYAQVAAMNSAPPLSPTVKRSTRTKDTGRDHSANLNAASASATTGPEPARSPSAAAAQQAADDAAAFQAAADAAATAAKCDLAAAALQAAADAAAIAANDPLVLRAVLLAAAATASALAQTTGIVQPRRRGGRPPPTRRADPNLRPRRIRRPAGTPAPTATGTRTARQPRWTQHPTTASSPPREGRKARQHTGASTASSNRAATSTVPATRNVGMSHPRLSPL